MPEPRPRLTVAIPVYNGETYLDETLRALRGQTYSDFDLLIADNASTDGTREIVEQHAADDERIRLLAAETNGGAAFNWNRCYAEASTELFSWNCADDVPLAGKYAACVELLDAEGPTTVLTYPATELIDETGVVTGGYDDVGPIDEPAPADRLLRIVRDLSLVQPLFGVIRTDVLRSTSGLGAYKRADTVLLGELAVRGGFGFVKEVLFRRRIHPEVSMKGTDAQIATLYTGRPDGGPALPFGRLLRGHLEAIGRAPISTRDKLECVRALRRWQYRKRMLNELTDAAKSSSQKAIERVRRR